MQISPRDLVGALKRMGDRVTVVLREVREYLVYQTSRDSEEEDLRAREELRALLWRRGLSGAAAGEGGEGGREDDGYGGGEDQVGGAEEVGASLGDHGAPLGGGGLHAQPEEGQA
jgi:hypothetical protein